MVKTKHNYRNLNYIGETKQEREKRLRYGVLKKIGLGVTTEMYEDMQKLRISRQCATLPELVRVVMAEAITQSKLVSAKVVATAAAPPPAQNAATLRASSGFPPGWGKTQAKKK